MINGGLACIVLVLSFVAVWLYAIFNKLKKLEAKEFLDRVYSNAEEDVAGKSVDELIRDAESRRAKRDSATGSRNSS